MASMPIPPPVGVCESLPSSVGPGLAEPLQVHLVADAVARPGMVDAALGRHRLEVQVVVVVLRPEAGHVVIDVADGQVGPDPPDAHRLEQQKRRRAGGVLGQGLVDPDADLLAGRQLAFDQVLLQYLIDQCRTQISYSYELAETRAILPVIRLHGRDSQATGNSETANLTAESGPSESAHSLICRIVSACPGDAQDEIAGEESGTMVSGRF